MPNDAINVRRASSGLPSMVTLPGTTRDAMLEAPYRADATQTVQQIIAGKIGKMVCHLLQSCGDYTVRVGDSFTIRTNVDTDLVTLAGIDQALVNDTIAIQAPVAASTMGMVSPA